MVLAKKYPSPPNWQAHMDGHWIECHHMSLSINMYIFFLLLKRISFFIFCLRVLNIYFEMYLDFCVQKLFRYSLLFLYIIAWHCCAMYHLYPTPLLLLGKWYLPLSSGDNHIFLFASIEVHQILPKFSWQALRALSYWLLLCKDISLFTFSNSQTTLLRSNFHD